MENTLTQMLEKGLAVAMGCTEPVAIAFAGASAMSYSKGEIKKIHLQASGNIIKNAFVVNIPGTDLVGLEYSVAIGAVCCDSAKKLELLDKIGKEEVRKAKNLVDSRKVTMSRLDTPFKLHMKVELETEFDTIVLEIVGTHTNITNVEKNGIQVFNGHCGESLDANNNCELTKKISLVEIFNFCDKTDVKNLEVLKKAIELNRNIALEGLKGDYGLQVGKTIKKSIDKKLMGDDLVNYAMMMAAGASDARMAGAEMPVTTNSGSGNQGIAASVPVIAVWEKLGDISEEKLLRALAISNLVTMYIKSKFGVLSALCAIVVSGAGAACGVVYLLGGKLPEIEVAIQNTLGNVSGIICDGAKSSCALKISTCTNAGMQAAILAINGLSIKSNEGIVEKYSENTIDNLATIANKGSSNIDNLVLEMILNKKNKN